LLAYVSFRREVDTWEIMFAALGEGRTLALPRVEPGGRLSLRAVRDPLHELVPGAFGIPEPAPSSPLLEPEAVDLVLVPGVAFDRRGYRLGYGGGYYDRLLADMRSPAVTARRSSPAVAAGLAYDFQIVDELPVGPHDQRVDLVLTERGVLAGASSG